MSEVVGVLRLKLAAVVALGLNQLLLHPVADVVSLDQALEGLPLGVESDL